MPLTRRDFLTRASAAALAVGVSPRAGAALGSAYQRAVLAKKPIGYWRLGEAAGPNVADSSGQAHHGVAHGAVTFKERGVIPSDFDTAAKLNGRDAFIEIPDHPDFSQPTSGKGLTVEAWMRPDALEFTGENDEGYIHWLGKLGPKQNEWALRFYSRTSKDRPNRISAYLFNLDGGLGAGAFFQDKLKPGEWLHIVACFEPGDAESPARPGVRIYKNGDLKLAPPSPGTLYNTTEWQIRPAHGMAPLRLGTASKKSFLLGALDEVAIYPRVLTLAEIRENFRAAKLP